MPTMLIVRPSARAAEDVETCLNAGWRVEVLSPVEIEADTAGLELLSERYAHADAVFWVSPTAIETAVPYLNLSDGIKIHITVGQGSRRVLERYLGRTVIAPHDGGRDFLMRRLREKGLQTELAEVYFRRHKPLNFQNFQSENITAAYITSTELVQSLFVQVPPQFSRFFKSLLYFTHHPRIAEALKREGVRSVETVPSLEYALSHFPV